MDYREFNGIRIPKTEKVERELADHMREINEDEWRREKAAERMIDHDKNLERRAVEMAKNVSINDVKRKSFYMS